MLIAYHYLLYQLYYIIYYDSKLLSTKQIKRHGST